MKVSLNPYFSNSIYYCNGRKKNIPLKYSFVKNNDADLFVKTSSVSNLSFGSSLKTSAGACLKKLDNITDPYSGVKMIPWKTMEIIEKKLYGCKNITEALKIIQPYESSMQRHEKIMYQTFQKYAKKHPAGTMQDCLRELNAKSLAKLRQEEFEVLNNIDAISSEAEPKTAKQIHEFIRTSKEQIITNERGKSFKRKRFIFGLDEILKNNSDKDLVEKIYTEADKLPKSKTNTEAFVVKYSNGYSSDEIAARLLKPSIASIEHITPVSCEGDSTLANFMTVSKDWNASRGNRPLTQYIKKHPDIPKNTQQYAQDIMTAIKDNRLTGCNWYPYVLKEKIFNESKGMIDIDISNYHIDADTAFRYAPKNIKNVYENLLSQNQKMTGKIN